MFWLEAWPGLKHCRHYRTKANAVKVQITKIYARQSARSGDRSQSESIIADKGSGFGKGDEL